MSFAPKAYEAAVRKMDGKKLLDELLYGEMALDDGCLECSKMLYAELLRRLSPKVDREKLLEAVSHCGCCVDRITNLIANLIESGQVPTVEE